MERLTKRKSDGTVLYAQLKAGQCVDIFDLANTYGNRLAEYEDTEMTPTEIVAFRAMLKANLDSTAIMTSPIGDLTIDTAGMRTAVDKIVELQKENAKLKELLKISCKSLKDMADTERNHHGDDILCGGCKYGDCVSVGCEGDYIGECPGFESDECFVWKHQSEVDELLKGE